MPQYAIFVYAPQLEGASQPDPEDLQAHDEHSAALQKSGGMRAAFALEDPYTATCLRGDFITDGPFLEAKELIAGFYVVDVPDLDAALALARQNPILRQGGGLEVRPVDASVLS
jgi:hypothetical protein